MPHSQKPPFSLQSLEREVRRRLGDSAVSPVPGIFMSADSLQGLLAEEQSAEALFRYFWDAGFGLEEMMRGGWTRQKQQIHAVAVARDALLLVFKSKPGALWKNGYCLLIEKQDGAIEPLLVKGNEHAAIVATPGPSDTVFLSAFSAAEAEARKVLRTVQPKPRSALLIFAAIAAGDRVQLRYHQFAAEEIQAFALPRQPSGHEVQQDG